MPPPLVWIVGLPVHKEVILLILCRGAYPPWILYAFSPGHDKIPPTLKTPLSDEMFVPPYDFYYALNVVNKA